ncbi:MAG TPA: hypothetical protein VGF50_12980 [Caulobacteraceae bacterium]
MAPAPPLRAMRWLAPGVDASAALTREPTECLPAEKPGTDAPTIYLMELGRAAFRTPLLLGGQGARAGLSCESCHRDGRNNPDFYFPGISDRPGAADVTTSVLSSHETDSVHGARPIPDLSGPKSALKFDQDPRSGALEGAIDRIITREFDGPEPPPAVLKGLGAYVRALSPAACPPAATRPVTAGEALADARRAVAAGIAALDHHDAPSAVLMIEAARSRLGDVDERYQAVALAPERRRLALASTDLDAAQADVARNPDVARTALTIWLAEAPGWSQTIVVAEPQSLYAPARLTAAAAQ